MSDLQKRHIENLFKLCRSRYCNDRHELKGKDLSKLLNGEHCIMILQPDPEDRKHDALLLCKICEGVVSVQPNKFTRKINVLCRNGSLPERTLKEIPLNIDLTKDTTALVGMRPCDVFLIPDSQAILK